METKTITLVGGSGFVGRYVVRRLAKAGYRLRIIVRRPDAALRLKTAGDVGQIVLVSGNIAEPESLAGKLEGSFAVINLAGILFESGRQRFDPIHAQGAEKLAQMALAAGVERFIHISALGVDKAAGSSYARTKSLGEKAVLGAFPQATVLRPSVIFGAEDNFLNQFAGMAVRAPALPLIGGGHTRFQPVYVDDVAAAVEACLTDPETRGQIYELGGPEIMTFQEILEFILDTIKRKRMLVSLPFSLAAAAGRMCELLPRPPLTVDQVALLRFDNIVSPAALGFARLGIQPLSMRVVAPHYLARFTRPVRQVVAA